MDPAMLYLCLVLFLFVNLASAVTSPCATELEQAIFKPKVCGVDYFENLACELNFKITVNIDETAAQLCRSFAAQNQVGLSILNAQGIDLCTLNNPTANAMSLIPKSLNYRTPADRLTIYQNYAVLPDFPPSSLTVDSSNLDLIGLLNIYSYLSLTIVDFRSTDAIPLIMEVVQYIESFPKTGFQNSYDLNMNAMFATITASVPLSETGAYFQKVIFLLQSVYTPVNEDLLSPETVYFLTYLLQFASVSGDQELPLSTRENNYQSTRNALLAAQGGAGIAKSFAQPLPINVVNDGVCFYTYNLYLQTGKLFRIVLSQTDMYFKKK